MFYKLDANGRPTRRATVDQPGQGYIYIHEPQPSCMHVYDLTSGEWVLSAELMKHERGVRINEGRVRNLHTIPVSVGGKKFEVDFRTDEHKFNILMLATLAQTMGANGSIEFRDAQNQMHVLRSRELWELVKQVLTTWSKIMNKSFGDKDR